MPRLQTPLRIIAQSYAIDSDVLTRGQASNAEANEHWGAFLESTREMGPYSVTNDAAISLKARFQCFKFEEGSNIIKPESHVQFVLLVLQGSVAVNTPTKTTYIKGEFVCEYAFFQAEQFLPVKLVVTGATAGIVAVLPFADLNKLCMDHPSLLCPIMLQLGTNAMAHARGERGNDAAARRRASIASDGGDGVTKAKQPQHMEVFYRKRMEKMASDKDSNPSPSPSPCPNPSPSPSPDPDH